MANLNVLNKLKGKNRFETLENYSMAGVVAGTLMFTVGVGLTAIETKGIPVIITMLGAVAAFVFTIVLVFVWLAKEIFGKES